MTIPILALMIAILTCIASPVNGTFRYFAPIAASTPLLLLLIRSGPKQEQLTPDGETVIIDETNNREETISE